MSNTLLQKCLEQISVESDIFNVSYPLDAMNMSELIDIVVKPLVKNKKDNSIRSGDVFNNIFSVPSAEQSRAEIWYMVFCWESKTNVVLDSY